MSQAAEVTDQTLAKDIIDGLYRSVLRRPADAEGLRSGADTITRHGLAKGIALISRAMLESGEYHSLIRPQDGSASRPAPERHAAFEQHNGPTYRVPNDLSVSDALVVKVLLAGQCFVEEWRGPVSKIIGYNPFDFLLFNNMARLPNKTPSPLADYDFQIASVPLRSILPDRNYLHLSYSDLDGYKRVFQQACDGLRAVLRELMKWNVSAGLLTFVPNFPVPQQNSLGRLLPRTELQNPAYFIQQLNAFLDREVSCAYKNAYILDADAIAGTFGRRFVQDEAVCITNHGGLLSDYGFTRDQARLEPPVALSSTYELRIDEFVLALWYETIAMYKTLRAQDVVKLVIVDLDDTLWRGVLADADAIAGDEIEGWPLGFIEALLTLKRRGIVLGVASKNEEAVVRALWTRVTSDKIRLEDFTFVEINWAPKVESVTKMIAAANVLPSSVIFIDDNPVERSAVKQAFPAIRLLGGDPYLLKRVLMWSPETQVAAITPESERRGAMLQAQVAREVDRSRFSREEFLASLQVEVEIIEIADDTHPRFARAFELVNKTNQFNTTGVRWPKAEVVRFFTTGGRLITFVVRDRYTEYGLVGVLFWLRAEIQQWVMSCRVLGLGVEDRVIQYLENQVRAAQGTRISAKLVETEANFPCRSVFADNAFTRENDRWIKPISR